MKKIINLLTIGLFASGCFSVSAETNVCKEDSAEFTAVKSNTPRTEISFIRALDVSKELSKLDDYGNIGAYFTLAEFTSLRGDFSWVSTLKIDLISNGDEINIINKVLDDNDQKITLKVNDSVNLVRYLSGPVSVRYTLGGTNPKSFKVNNKLCFNLQVNADKNYTDLPK